MRKLAAPSLLAVALVLLGPAPVQARQPSDSAESGKPRARRQGLRQAPPPAPRRHLEQLEPGPGYTVLDPAHAFGTPLAVRRLGEALRRYHTKFPDAAPVMVMDLSRRGGGRLGPHASHRTGRDADVRLVLNRRTSRLVDATPATLDVERTWFIIAALIETGDVEYIFINRRLQRPLYRHAASLGLGEERLEELFQLAHGGRTKLGIIRHEPGHLGHFHVRFRRQAPGEVPRLARPIVSGPCQVAALAWSRPECRGPSSPL